MAPRRHDPAIKDPRLLAAIALAILFHGALLLAGSFRRTYDAYVHIFLADHYARDWFSTWDTRWYTGFTTTSYPPGTHHMIALASRLVGLEKAFVLVQLGAIVVLVIGVFRFSRLWVSPTAAGWAALLATLSSSIAETVHTFGQLPTIFSLGMLLNATPFVHRWVLRGGGRELGLAAVCTAATTAGHHVTTLFGTVFFLGPVIAAALLQAFRSPLPGETGLHPRRLDRTNAAPLVARRIRRLLPALTRAAIYGGVVIAALVIVVLPYWLWSSSDPITQIPIPHASRANYLEDINAGLVFWVVPWGMLLVALLPALVRGFAGRAWPLAASVALLALLGTGGTTPIPRLLLGDAYEILTLDRFTFWATIAVLPLAGRLVDSLVGGRILELIRIDLGRLAPPVIQATLVIGLIASAVFAANMASTRRFQPDPIDPVPIVDFLDKDQHGRWRYLTLGFGDQMAWLAANTTATTVDGNYHSARRLPELTSTPVERLEGAKFRGVPGIGSLQQFLAVPSKYHLKFVFSNDEFYDPLLWASGWHRLERLSNGIVVWEREDVPPLPAELPTREAPPWQRLLWGTVPMASILGALCGLAWAVARPGRVQEDRAAVPALMRPLDRRLEVVASRPIAGEPKAPRWQHRHTFGAVLLDPCAGRRRRRSLGLGLIAVAAVITGAGLMGSSNDAPEEQVHAYYEALDFRFFDEAHRRLDPTAAPPLDQYLLERSVEDGLVASYGKLDRIATELIAFDGDSAQVRADLDYITALQAYSVTVVHDLVRVEGSWYLVPEPADATVPPDQFVRRPSVDFVSQGRRQVTTETTAYADIIDRPEVITTSARLVQAEGRWVIIGEFFNQDVDPADVTVTGQLLDASGDVLAQYDAAQIIIHKVLPKERSSFRIEFEGIAGALDVRDPSAGPFDPQSTTPLEIDDTEVVSFAIYTKAVVTGRDLDRSLVFQGLRLEREGDDLWLSGRVRNDGTETVTIPHLVLTYRAADHDPVWVDHAYLDTAIRPQRSTTFRLPLVDASRIEATAAEGTTYDNGIGTSGFVPPSTPLIPVAGGPGYSGIDLSMAGFVRSSS